LGLKAIGEVMDPDVVAFGTGLDINRDVDAKESTKPAISRLDWRKYEQKSIS